MQRPLNVALQASPERIDLLVRGERVASYRPNAPVPGFDMLMAAEGRILTQADETTGTALWLAQDDAFDRSNLEPSDRGGRIVSREVLARRGSQSVGFRQECAWIGPDTGVWLRDVRLIRVQPGPSAGCMLDMTLTLLAPEADPVTLDSASAPLLAVRAARPLFPAGGGQFRNSLGEYEVEAVNGQSAAWCGCIGVVQGETVGFALLDHPQNPFSPAPWRAQEDGLFSPSPFLRHRMELMPGASVTFRYRLLTHRGYVDQGWATERMREFAREPMRP